MLSDIVVALPAQAGEITARASHTKTWPTLQAKNIDPVKLSTLAFLLRGLQPDDGPVIEYMKGFKELRGTSEEEPVVLLIPSDLVDLLATLDENRLKSISTSWARTEEATRDGWNAKEAERLLVQLSQLARSAKSQRKALLLWLSP